MSRFRNSSHRWVLSLEQDSEGDYLEKNVVAIHNENMYKAVQAVLCGDLDTIPFWAYHNVIAARWSMNSLKPKIENLTPRLRKTASKFKLKYRCESHTQFPHVVKFSGGRSSGTMLFKLLESKALDASRGDVVVFNNTSAEHPATYDFVRKCKEECERDYGVPFFIVEYCTYEDSSHGEYIRIPTFRLANGNPQSKANPEGYRWRGEAYEELLSWNGIVPSIFQRTCTVALKMQTTRNFLREWLLNVPETKRRGHFGSSSRIDPKDLYRRHLKYKGEVPMHIFIEKKQFVLSQQHFREGQQWSNYSSSYKPYINEFVSKKILGDTVHFGENSVQYIGIVGLRFDEKHRVAKLLLRSNPARKDNNYVGENVYAPLHDDGYQSSDVNGFWNGISWRLSLEEGKPLSNCTFCFLKGVQNLRLVREHFLKNQDSRLAGSPCDLNWWVDIERKYAKDFDAEGKQARTEIPDNVIGFFGARSGYLYKYLASESKNSDFDEDYPDGFLPCDCTD